MSGLSWNKQESEREDVIDNKRHTIIILSCLLVVQLVVAAFLTLSSAKYQAVQPSAQLLKCDLESIDKVSIEEGDLGGGKKKAVLVLQREEGSWILPDYYRFPASSATVTELFGTLRSLMQGLPVTTTADAADRFLVSSNKFARKVSLSKNNQTIVTLYVGTSAGFRTTYVRLSDSNDIYSVDLPVYQLSVEPRDWINRGIAEFKSRDVMGIDAGKFELREVNRGNWILNSEGQDHLIRKNVAIDFVNKLALFSIDSVLGTKPEPDFNLENPILSYIVHFKKGKDVTYSFGKPNDKNYCVLKISDRDYYFAVDSRTVKEFQEVTVESLMKQDAVQRKKEAELTAKMEAEKAAKNQKAVPPTP